MKKIKVLAILGIAILGIAAASVFFLNRQKEESVWGDEATYGEIDEAAEIVDKNDFDTEWQIDEYLSLTEQNQSETPYVFDNYRLYYNKAADQLGLAVLKEYEMTDESESEGALIYQFSDSNTNNYLTVRDGKISRVSYEHSGNFSDEEEYKKCIAECIPAIYGGVPYLKKYDINSIFLEMCDSLKEKSSFYQTEFNGYSISVKRDYNLVTVGIIKSE